MTGAAADTADEDFVFNPFAPGFTDDPYPHYREVRERVPVHHHPLGFWLLSRYADVSALLRAGLSVDARHATPGPLGQLYEELGADLGDRRAGGMSMLDKDPPDHTRLRRLVSKAFTPRAVEALTPGVDTLVDEALDRIADAGSADLVEALAFPLPFAVISRMLGMPPADHERLRGLTGLLVRSLEPVTEPDVVRAIAAADAELTAMTADVVAWKREHPADDLLTALITAEDNGDVLGDDELVAQVVLLYVAGHETTVNLIAGGTLALLRHPDQLAALRADPGLIGNAVEELLRYDSPVQSSRRITLAPYRVGDREIPAGSFVLANLAGANRDPAFFGTDADELRLGRPDARQHLSFGGGPHHCLGAALARLEARTAIGGLVRRFPGLALDGEVAWNGRINLRGPERLPVRV
ncbi:cytochrome P450 [Prauserella shujinwangii]|uniref:Cytochrome P450 n=1 Tax=Prauserella shujinwangii TaxID=1453103 RepID=A0A2T0LMC2_9PSEU|nr:cytochrome P450 [Prauserella shujinwangii]PRX44227.1 cytochrome P450 [Prauserella shujinwangii]